MHFTSVFIVNIQSIVLAVQSLDMDANVDASKQFCLHISYIWDDRGGTGVEADGN